MGLTGAPQLQSWWNVTTAALSLLAAIVTIGNLPQLLRMPKIAKELRGQAGFLEEQQALLQAIQDSVSDGIMLIDEEGQIKAFNAAALRILWGRDEHQSKPLPEMKELAIRALVQGQSDQEIVRWEGRLIERFTTNVPGYGKLYVFRDITMRRNLESERLRLERVIASMKEGFAIVSVDTMRIVSTNPAMEQMLGYDKNELVGREFSEIQAGAEEERKAAVETISSIVSRDGFWEGEIRNRRKDGAELLAHTTVSLTREGESQYFSFIQVDVTEQNRLREEKGTPQGEADGSAAPRKRGTAGRGRRARVQQSAHRHYGERRTGARNERRRAIPPGGCSRTSCAPASGRRRFRDSFWPSPERPVRSSRIPLICPG